MFLKKIHIVVDKTKYNTVGSFLPNNTTTNQFIIIISYGGFLASNFIPSKQ
jgi:hypothetical protein